jgi:hypothetical protein
MNDTTTTSNWSDDVLQREEYSKFLTNLLTSHFTRENNSPSKTLTFALDSGWGGGKTFFVDRWMKDLEQSGHPVLKFDAWENDFSNEPSVAFMATLSSALEPYIKELSTIAKKNSILKKLSVVKKSLRKGLLPATKIVAAGLLKKTTGIVVGELTEAFTTGDTDIDEESVDALIEGSKTSLEKGLDTYFEKVLKQHQDTAKSKKQFKIELEDLVTELVKENKYKPPFVFFIDELDRARPDYAIRLLEEIKHLFGVPGICFCISTNLSQLTHSIKSVYGEGFDGYQYLKRFFDFEYSLPEPNYFSYAKLLMQNTPRAIRDFSYLGFLHYYYSKDGALEKAFAAISEMFELDLRSQKQIFWMAQAALDNCQKTLGSNTISLHPLFMFFLCALRHQKPDMFETFQRLPNNKTNFKDLMAQAALKYPEIKYRPKNGSSEAELINFPELLYCYFEMARQEHKVIAERSFQEGATDIYSALRRSIAEYGVFIDAETSIQKTVLSQYAGLARAAGQISFK